MPLKEGIVTITSHYLIDEREIEHDTVLYVKGVSKINQTNVLSKFTINDSAQILSFNKNLTQNKKLNISNPNFDSDYKVSYLTSNPEIATINNGVVTAHKEGNAKITVSAVEKNTSQVVRYVVHMKVIK